LAATTSEGELNLWDLTAASIPQTRRAFHGHEKRGSSGPNTMADGGIQQILERMGVKVRIDEAALMADEATEYGGWKRLGMALGHFAGMVEKNERDGYFTVGLIATCPSMPGLVAGLQHSGPRRKPIKIGIPSTDERGLSLAAVNRMIEGAIHGVKARETRRP
jgi:hypothetical protein